MSDLPNAGFGNHLARPLFREKHRPDMTEAEAEALLKEGLQVSAGCMLLSAQAMTCFLASATLLQSACRLLHASKFTPFIQPIILPCRLRVNLADIGWLQVCYYRDKSSINKFQKAKVTAEGVTISDTFALETKWSHKVCCLLLLNVQGMAVRAFQLSFSNCQQEAWPAPSAIDKGYPCTIIQWLRPT